MATTHAAAVETEDAALVRAAQVDRGAFGALYERYLPRVYQYLRGYTRSDEDAADLTQQAFLKALDGLATYDERKAPFAGWLFRVARNVATDAHRRRRDTVSLALLPELPQVRADDPEAAALRREALARLRGLLAELSPELRELIWLRFVADLGVDEVATAVGKSPDAVRKQLSRTLKALGEGYDE